MNQYTDHSITNTISTLATGAIKNVFPTTAKYPPAEGDKKQKLKTEDSTKLAVSSSESSVDPRRHPQQHSSYSRSNSPPRRVWVKLAHGTPTTVIAYQQNIVDDLKTSIIQKYPNSVASFADAADIQLLIDQSSTISPSSVSNRPTLKSAPIKLEPDKNVWSILDTYFPSGMTLQDALIIDVVTDRLPSNFPPPPQARYSEPHYSMGNNSPRDPQFLKIHNHNVKHPQPIPIKQSPSQIYSNPYQQKYPKNYPYSVREKSVSPSSMLRNLPNHRRSQSNPLQSPLSAPMNSTETENPKAVLLLPKNFSLAGGATGGGNNKKRNQSLYDSFGSEIKTDDDLKPNQSMLEPPEEKPDDEKEVYEQKEERPKTSRSPSKEQIETKKEKEKAKPDAAKDKVLPSISVLIVEDNAINQAILGAFLRKRKIHYQIAKNGQEAIDKWRSGGFHLVLMDIQLPVKSGIEATKEIRHLEKLNKIGVFDPNELSMIKNNEELKPEDKLDLNVFRSPVIIVALTASSNSSVDRKNALTAGCNDYLTKPVNLVWLQDKITEWGCMQALIDFEGWKTRNVGLWKK